MNMRIFIIFIFTFSAQIAAAQGYTPLAGVPGVDPANQSTEQYINALYILSISIASFLAVVKIIFGGVKYMLSDVVTDKGDAKKDIKGALLGLLIVLAAVLVLNTINPTLTTLNFLKDAEPLSVTLRSDGTPAGGGAYEQAFVGNRIIDINSSPEQLEAYIAECTNEETGGTYSTRLIQGKEYGSCTVPEKNVELITPDEPTGPSAPQGGNVAFTCDLNSELYNPCVDYCYDQGGIMEADDVTCTGAATSF